MSKKKDEPLDLVKYFNKEEGFQYVRRKELQQVLSYLIDKGTFANAMDALDGAISETIDRRVKSAMDAFILGMENPEEESRIITLK